MMKQINKFSGAWMRRALLLGVVLLLLIGLSGVVIQKKRTSIYPYEVEQDYHYNLNAFPSIEIEVSGGEITLPDTLGPNYTALLKLNIESTTMGKLFQPALRMKSGKTELIQYFEHGAKGGRYINLSSLIGQGATQIELLGENITFGDQTGTLTLFENPVSPESKVLVISPHPDDAEIAAYGLYSRYPDAFVLTVTAGEAGDLKYDELYTDTLSHQLKIGQIRTWNSVTVPLLAGIAPENALNFGFFDGTLKLMYERNPSEVESRQIGTTDINTFRRFNISPLEDSLRGGANWDALVENLKLILIRVDPDIIVTPYPALDTHDDHKYASVALFQALRDLKIRKGNLLLYSNHYVANEYYPYGKTGGVVSLPPNFVDDIYFKGVYSCSLPASMQGDKVLALESMNDLRPDTEWRFSENALSNSIDRIKTEVTGKENSYFKRAVRSNELFFVVPIQDIYTNTFLNELMGGNAI